MGQSTPSIVATASITLSTIVDIDSVTRYYYLGTNKPQLPTTNPPPENWSTVEPSYEVGSTESLYFTDCTTFTNGTFKYSEVSESSSFEAVKNIQIGGRNLIRNSINLIFEKYYFVANDQIVIATHDGNGNVSLVSPIVSVTDDGAGHVSLTYASITTTDDGAGNISLNS